MMTSRCEYRLLLRQDNADIRLTEKARRTGLISDERYGRLMRKLEKTAAARAMLERSVPPTEALAAFLASRGETPPKTGVRLFDLLKRPSVDYTSLAGIFDDLPALDRETIEQVEVAARYDGYIEKQLQQVERARSLEETRLPADYDYGRLHGLRLEARQKLNAVRPETIGKAGRISGVSPADIAVLIIAAKRGFDA